MGSWVRIVSDAAVLLVAAGVAGYVHSFATPISLNPTPAPTPVAAVQGAVEAAAHAEGEPGWMIHTARAHELYLRAESQGDVFFVDARNPDEFTGGHVPGAFSVPPDAFFGGRYPATLDRIPKASTVVVYCGGGACDASKLVAIRFREAGFPDVLVYQDGFTGWSAERLPQQQGDAGVDP